VPYNTVRLKPRISFGRVGPLGMGLEVGGMGLVGGMHRQDLTPCLMLGQQRNCCCVKRCDDEVSVTSEEY